MENVKPWQIILMIAAVLAMGFTVWRFATAGRVVQPDRFMTVDVTTGQLFEIKLGRAKGMILPAKHPETGQRTLFPVHGQEGDWKIEPGFLEASLPGEVEGSKVQSNGTLDILPGEPKVHVLVP